MALWDEVTNRYPTQALIGLTNPQSTTASSVDTTKRDAAVADAKARFKRLTAVAADDTDADHTPILVTGVIAYLQYRGGSGPGVAEVTLAEFDSECENFRKTTAAKRVGWVTSTKTTPTDERTGKPPLDRTHLDDIRPDPPGGTESD